jgi:hypothetical protein
MILAEHGIFFITIIMEKKLGKLTKFTFKFDLSEQYFSGQTPKGAFEYDTGRFIVILNGSKTIKFINRNLRKEDNIQIPNISDEEKYCSLLPFPYFDFQDNPYVLIKDSQSLNVINVLTYQSRVMVKNSPYKWSVARTGMMDFAPC